MIPDLDAQIGITTYSTGYKGCGGRIRASTDDFQVSEMLSKNALDSIRDSGNHAVYMLVKHGIDTNHAIQDIHARSGARLAALGLKDAAAQTRQYVCDAKKTKRIVNVSASRYHLEHLGFVPRPMSKKDMIGNRFAIRLTDCDGLSDFAEYSKVLNFFGYQRFGSKRPVTHHIGRAILKHDYKEAVRLIVSFTSPYDSKENTEIRAKLADEACYSRYLDMVPHQMDIERTVLKQMIKNGDHRMAIKAIPLQLRRFYIQAYQSFLFNCSLSSAFEHEDLLEARQGDVCFGPGGKIAKYSAGTGQNLAFPTVGYSYYKKTRFDGYISKILEQERVVPGDFFIKEMQEVSSEGGFRHSAIQCSEQSATDDVVRFALSRGSFATIILREIIKPKDPIAAGF